MESIFITSDRHEFIIHFEPQDQNYRMIWVGSVYEIVRYDDGQWAYQSNESSDLVDKKENARCWFEFSFCWRGVWEGRVYFKDEEYWGEEMATIAGTWEQIENICKEKIKADNPKKYHFDD